MSVPDLITAMMRPEFYPHHPPSVTLVQTHISYVLLAGDEVFKIKKPVRFSFLDFSTLEARRHFCHEEVRLNRRLAPTIYRGVVAVCRAGDTYQLAAEDDATAIEYVVQMRRLPDDRMLDRILERDAVTLEMIESVATQLAQFHRGAETSAAITAQGDPAAILQVLEDNFANARRFRDHTVSAADDDAIQAFLRTFLRSQASLLHRRQTTGRIRDCHGDLHTEHVCFIDGLVIFDCIEFNPRFRYIDVASEVAFLAMDLDFHDHSELSAHFVDRYSAAAADPDVARLVPFYKCARAYLRGEVDSMRSAEEEVPADEREAARAAAAKHFELAYRNTWAYVRSIVAITGLSGTGKSTIAAALARRTGFIHISSDVTRKQLGQGCETAASGGAYETGLYTPELSARTYAAMLSSAAQRLPARAVILDATFQRRADRDRVRTLARQYGVPVLFVECDCDETSARARIERRSGSGQSDSDADWQVYLEQRQRFDAFKPDEKADHFVISTDAPTQEVMATIENELRVRLLRC